MEKLSIMIDVTNKDFYMNSYNSKELHSLNYKGSDSDAYIARYNKKVLHNLSIKGTYSDAINEALAIWGLDEDKVHIEILDLLDIRNYENPKNINTADGFFHIEFKNMKSLQCYLEKKANGKGFKKEISLRNSGANSGQFKDCNKWFGEFAGKILIQEAENQGIRIVD